MPICDGCGVDYHYRRNVDGERLCECCIQAIKNPFGFVRSVNQNYSRLSEQISKLFAEIEAIRGPPQTPFCLIPTKHVLNQAKLALKSTKNYKAFSDVLAHYYKIRALAYLTSKAKVPEQAIACYYSHDNVVYAKKSITLRTAFHEFYHVLEANGLVKSDIREKCANQYADACTYLLNLRSID